MPQLNLADNESSKPKPKDRHFLQFFGAAKDSSATVKDGISSDLASFHERSIRYEVKSEGEGVYSVQYQLLEKPPLSVKTLPLIIEINGELLEDRIFSIPIEIKEILPPLPPAYPNLHLINMKDTTLSKIGKKATANALYAWCKLSLPLKLNEEVNFIALMGSEGTWGGIHVFLSDPEVLNDKTNGKYYWEPHFTHRAASSSGSIMLTAAGIECHSPGNTKTHNINTTATCSYYVAVCFRVGSAFELV